MLLASAAKRLKAAIGIVTQTRTELNEQTLTMNGLAAPGPVPPPLCPEPYREPHRRHRSPSRPA
jgi:hypothetical protein